MALLAEAKSVSNYSLEKSAKKYVGDSLRPSNSNEIPSKRHHHIIYIFISYPFPPGNLLLTGFRSVAEGHSGDAKGKKRHRKKNVRNNKEGENARLAEPNILRQT